MNTSAHILVVALDPDTRRRNRALLEAAGYTVIEAHDEESGIEQARALRPAAVVFSPHAGEAGNGFAAPELCARLKALPGLADLPVVEIVPPGRNGRLAGAGRPGAAAPDITLGEGDAGDLGAVVGTLTRLRESEAALRASRRRFQALAAATGEAVWSADASGNSADSYEWWESTTGQVREYAHGGGWLGQVHPTDRSTVEERWQRALRERLPFEMEYRLRTQAGDYRLFRVRGVPIFEANGTFVEWVGTATDITQQRATERRLEFLAHVSDALSSSLDYEATLQQIADLMIPELADWCVVDIADESGNVNLAAVAHVEPDKRRWAYEIRRRYPVHVSQPDGLPNVIRTGEPLVYPHVTDEMLVAVAQDEEMLAVLREIGYRSIIVVPLWVSGRALGAVTFVSSDESRLYDAEDVAFAAEVGRRAALAVENARLYREARQVEADLRQLNATLELRVKERTADLERSNRELDQFAYIASHDLRAPLRAIDHLANWIAEDSADAINSQSREHLAKLRGRVKRMERLLEDLLLFSRVGRQRHQPEEVDLGELVRGAVDLLALPPGMRVTVAESMPIILTERVPLETIVRNLVENAAKHHDAPERGSVSIEARHVGEWVEISVTDDGPGIAPQFHDRIFGVFQTLKPRDQLEGSGMGLAIVRKAVEVRGGAVQLESDAGAGATFRFTWPAAEGRPAE